MGGSENNSPCTTSMKARMPQRLVGLVPANLAGGSAAPCRFTRVAHTASHPGSPGLPTQRCTSAPPSTPPVDQAQTSWDPRLRIRHRRHKLGARQWSHREQQPTQERQSQAARPSTAIHPAIKPAANRLAATEARAAAKRPSPRRQVPIWCAQNSGSCSGAKPVCCTPAR